MLRQEVVTCQLDEVSHLLGVGDAQEGLAACSQDLTEDGACQRQRRRVDADHHVLAWLHIGAVADQQRGVAFVHGVDQTASPFRSVPRNSTLKAAVPRAMSCASESVTSTRTTVTLRPARFTVADASSSVPRPGAR